MSNIIFFLSPNFRIWASALLGPFSLTETQLSSHSNQHRSCSTSFSTGLYFHLLPVLTKTRQPGQVRVGSDPLMASVREEGNICQPLWRLSADPLNQTLQFSFMVSEPLFSHWKHAVVFSARSQGLMCFWKLEGGTKRILQKGVLC